MQMPAPSKFHKKLEVLIGDWTSEETMFPMPWDPEGGKAKGRYKVRSAPGGFGIVQEYEQKRGGKVSYTGHGVMGYDEQEKCYLWHWSDSMGGVPNTVTRGTWTDNKLVFQHSGQHGHSRYTYTFRRAGSVDFSIDCSQDGQQWQPFMTGRYARKAAKK